MSDKKTIRLIGPKEAKGKATVRYKDAGHVAPLSSTNMNARARLPLLLAGPIVRRVSRTAVSVWLATSIPVSAILRLYKMSDDGVKLGPRVGDGSDPSLRLGDQLHITLVTATTDGDLPPNALIGYDIALEAADESAPIDGDFLLEDGDITYAGLPLPAFITPGSHPDRFRVAHGSCRKLHGNGEDAMIALDKAFAATPRGSRRDKWPCALLLTGDQIYADDVDARLLAGLLPLGQALLGWDEVLDLSPSVKGVTVPDTAKVKDSPLRARIAGLPPGERGSLVKALGFTVDKDVRGSHLFGFGEYAAMYLVAWSPEVLSWHPDATSRDRPAVSKLWASFDGACNLQKASTANRRVFANVPVYMIYDDHDVTDDWNVTATVHHRIASNAGKHVVANALAAYWAFQSIGNDPDNPSDRRADILGYLEGRGAGAAGFDKLMWGRVGGEASSLGQGGFHDGYLTATEPPVVVLDTRTYRLLEKDWRDPKGQLDLPPGLMRDAQLRQMTANIKRLAGESREPVVIVSPAPFLGFHAIEAAQAQIGRVPRTDWSEHRGRTYDQAQAALAANFLGAAAARLIVDAESKPMDMEYDPEAWGFNPKAFIGFLNALVDSQRSRFVILSGDVHYAFVGIARYTRRRTVRFEPSGPKYHYDDISLTQLTSSALKNQEELTGKKMPAMGAAGALALGDKLYGHVDNSKRFYLGSEPTLGVGFDGPKEWVCRLVVAYRALGRSGAVVGLNNFGLVDISHTSVAQATHTAGAELATSVDWSEIEQLE